MTLNKCGEHFEIYNFTDFINLEEVLKRTLFCLVFLSFLTLSAADTVAIFPIGAKSRGEWTVAKDIDRAIVDRFRDFRDADPVSFKELLSVNDRKALNRCRENLKCHSKISRSVSRKVDFFIFSKLMITKSRIVINTYLFDRKHNRLESARIEFDEFAEINKIADETVDYWNRFLKKHTISSKSSSRSSRSSKKEDRYDDSGYDDYDDDDSGYSPKIESIESIITSGLRSYADGDLRNAEQYFKKAAGRDVVAKKLYNNIQEVIKFTARSKSAIKAKNYDEAVALIAKAEKANDEITGLGVKYRVYSQDRVERVTYLEPTNKDIKTVDVIHKKYAKTTEKSRKTKIAKITEIEKWLNSRILERESKLKQYDIESKNAAENEKKEYAELAKKIKDLKYQWEQSDSELEQKIVALENKLTLFEQREKGVVKVAANTEDEKARAKEVQESDKKYNEILKKLREEKDQFYAKQKKAIEDGSKKTEAAVVKLEEKKKANEAKIVEIDKKIKEEMEKFDVEERKYSTGNEDVKMKNEDEDRKFKVQVEKEYQVKFDELNKKLQEYDQQEAEKKKSLEKYDREIEEYMTKNVEIMSKYQDELEKERTKIDEEYKTKKEAAKADAEKKYNEELEKLTAEKTATEAKIAEKETPQLKKQLAGIEKKIKNHEGGKEEFIGNLLMQVDMEYEAKSAEIDQKLVKRNQELQKDNNKFRDKKLAEKKQAEKDFKGFENRKAMFKKTIDNQILQAQKARDKKIEDRQKERAKLSGTWDKNREQREKALERKLKPMKDQKARLEQENEKISAQVTDINNKWAVKSDDMKVKHNEESEKFEKNWQERFDKATTDKKESKEAIEVKYADKIVTQKKAQKEQKVKWEEEIQSLNEEKQRRKEERAKILEGEKQKWDAKKKQWTEEEKQRKIDKIQFSKDMKKMNAEDRKEASARKKAAEKEYDDATKEIYEKEISEIAKRFKNEYKITRTREVTGVKAQSDIGALKADALAKNGLNKLQNKDLLSARRAFAEALFIEKDNQIALDGMKSINITAKSMYWEAFGMRETNKSKAKEIFTLLTKTLMPSNEYFVKSRIALEEL